jgi:hypothetical protein
MMTPPRDGGAAPFLTALRGVGTFAKARAKADIDIQSVNAGGRNAVQPDDDGRRVSLFEEGALQKAIMDVTVQAPSRLVIVTGGDPNDVDGLCSAARNHLKADARNSVDFLVVSAQWNAFNLGARLTEIGENVSLKTAASAPEVTQQLNNLFGTPSAAPAQTAKRQL